MSEKQKKEHVQNLVAEALFRHYRDQHGFGAGELIFKDKKTGREEKLNV